MHVCRLRKLIFDVKYYGCNYLLSLLARVNAREGTTVLHQGTELAGPGGSEPQGVLVGTNPTYPDLDSDLLRSVHSRNL